jgi:hypothetical protein
MCNNADFESLFFSFSKDPLPDLLIDCWASSFQEHTVSSGQIFRYGHAVNASAVTLTIIFSIHSIRRRLYPGKHQNPIYNRLAFPKHHATMPSRPNSDFDSSHHRATFIKLCASDLLRRRLTVSLVVVGRSGFEVMRASARCVRAGVAADATPA